VKAGALVRAEVVDGRTRIAEMRCEPPLVVRETPDALYLVGAAGGPLGGDELSMHIDVGVNALVRVRSAAATLAQPGPTPVPSRTTTTITVGDGGRLVWEPEPLVSVRGSHHHVDTSVTLGVDATLTMVEEIVLGRHDEASGRVTTTMRVDQGGSAVIAHDLDIGADAPEWSGPSIIGSARVVRTELHVGPHAPVESQVHIDGPLRAAIFPIAAGAALVVSLASTLGDARRGACILWGSRHLP
jgi:urease accessory protein